MGALSSNTNSTPSTGNESADDASAHMENVVCCTCNPGNMLLCCDRLACCPGGPTALNGNKLIEVRSSPGPPPMLDVHISHTAGRLCDLVIPDSILHCLILPLVCIFLVPTLFFARMLVPVETRLHLRRVKDSTSGVVTRRYACCTCRTPVSFVQAIETENQSENSEGPPRIYITHATGTSKLEISEGSVAGLEGAVNPWINNEALAADCQTK